MLAMRRARRTRTRSLACGVLAMALVAGFPQGVAAQSAQDRVEQIVREHGESLGDLCRALDRAILEAMPSWSDPDLRWALFGVPTDEERARLLARSSEVGALLDAMQPLVERRLGEADRTNASGIDQAVQLSEVLIPLARARGLLIAAAATEPALTGSDEARRGFEQARRIAELSESVSAWSDLERALIATLASLRLNDAERAVEGVREAREALRENRDLEASSAQSVQTLRAAEALLVAVARSTSEAREALPDDPEDRERLRVRFAAIGARTAQTADTRQRVLKAECDRLADQALEAARNAPYGSTAWLAMLERAGALLRGVDAGSIGETAGHVLGLVDLAGSSSPAPTVADESFGALQPLALALELRSIDPGAAGSLDLDRIVRLGLEFDRLASGTTLGRSALDRVSLLLRARIGADPGSLPRSGSSRDRLVDLLDTLVSRPEADRSNIDLLASVLVTPTEAGPATVGLIERVQTLMGFVERANTLDADAARGLTLAGAWLTDAVARNQVAALMDQPAITRDDERRAIELLASLSERLDAAGGDPGLVTVMASLGLDDPAAVHEALTGLETTAVPAWIVEALRTRASLLSGNDDPIAGSDGAIVGAALYASRALPGELDVRSAVPMLDQTRAMASGALRCAPLLATRKGVYTRLAITAFSVALYTDDDRALARLADAALAASARVEHELDRDWLRLIHADALLRRGRSAEAFAVYRDVVATTAPEDRGTRQYWHASMRMLEVLAAQNADGSRTAPIAREIRRLRLQPSWRAHADICDRIDAIARSVMDHD